MSMFAFRSAGRSFIRRPQLPNINRQPNLLTKRHNATKPNERPQSKPHDDPTTSNGTSIPVPNTVATLPLWQRLGPISSGLGAYARSQRKRPYLTQFCSSLVIYFLGDLSAQSINGDEYDPKRTARALVISAFSSIPSYNWFIFLGNQFNYPSRLLSLGTKVVVNQIVFAPLFNTYFFGMQALLSGDNLAQIWERLRHTVPVSWINSCKVWPAVTAFSFAFIPAEYRSITAGVVAIGWQTYLSFLNRKAETMEEAERALELSDGKKDTEKCRQPQKSTEKSREKVEA